MGGYDIPVKRSGPGDASCPFEHRASGLADECESMSSGRFVDLRRDPVQKNTSFIVGPRAHDACLGGGSATFPNIFPRC